MSILREAIAADRRRRYGHELDPATDIAITVGATEALAAAILAFASQDSEVIVLEPAYDSYPAAVALAGQDAGGAPAQSGVKPKDTQFSPNPRRTADVATGSESGSGSC